MTAHATGPPASATTRTCTSALPGKYGNVPVDACNSNYNFNPQFAPAVAVAVIFGLLLLSHIVLGVVFRKRFTWVIIMGASWETAAFIIGALGTRNQQSTPLAYTHTILFLLAPLWINAFAYMSFARMVYFYLPEKRIWRIPAPSLARYFVLADISAFVVQAIGTLMASPAASPEGLKTGTNVYMSGIGLQEGFVLVFVGLMIVFHRKAARIEQNEVRSLRPRSWQPLLYALYGVMLAITIRIAYRISEFAGGVTPSNPVPFHEAYSYGLDACPMILALLMLLIWHPGRFLVGPESQFPNVSRKERKALRMQRNMEQREDKMSGQTGSEATLIPLDLVYQRTPGMK